VQNEKNRSLLDELDSIYMKQCKENKDHVLVDKYNKKGIERRNIGRLIKDTSNLNSTQATNNIEHSIEKQTVNQHIIFAEKKSKKLLDYALEPPKDPSKILTKLNPTSTEYTLIQEIFKNGNCYLNTVTKLYRKSLVHSFTLNKHYNSKTILFFSNTIECIMSIIDNPKGFKEIHEQDMIFSNDLSIAYRYYNRYSNVYDTVHDEEGIKNWRAVICGVILNNIWKEKKSYPVFCLNFERYVGRIRDRGYNCVYFERNNFYLILDPKLCISAYLIDFNFT